MIRRLQARGFRNLVDVDVELSPGLHLLFGPTGQGKTSLLEVIYVLCTTKSFRSSKLEHCCAHPARDEMMNGGFWLAADIAGAGAETGLRSRLELSWSPVEGLRRRVNGEVVSASEYLSVQSVVVSTSLDAEILVGTPALRRRLLDRIVVAQRPVLLRTLTTYRRLLEQKRALLQQHAVDRDQLRGLNTLVSRAGAEIQSRRSEAAQQLERQLASADAELGLGWPPLHLNYRSSGGVVSEASDRCAADMDASRDEERARSLEQALESALGQEIARRRPLLGPHLDGVEFVWHDAPPAQRASAGELKVLSLLLTLAQLRVLQHDEGAPILLLDDLDTEVDAELLKSLEPLFYAAEQTLVSSNRPAVFDSFLSPTGPTVEALAALPSGAESSSRDLPVQKKSWFFDKGRIIAS